MGRDATGGVRKRRGRELWSKLCEAVATDDGLPAVSTKGIWTAKKLFHICNYLEMFTTAMAGNKHFPGGLTYCDLYCGSGVSVVEQEGLPAKRYPGSAYIAANMTKPFSRLILSNISQEQIDACKGRIIASGFNGEIIEVCGDVETTIDKISTSIPRRSLTVAIVDPFNLAPSFSAIKKLSASRAIDIMSLLMDRLDIGRNYKSYYSSNVESSLDKFLGVDWRVRIESLANPSAQNVREEFAKIYTEQLAGIGFEHSRHWPIEGPNGPMYRLVYASRHSKGLEFMDIALKEDFGGELTLF